MTANSGPETGVLRYRTRQIEKRLAALARHFKVVLITGARQAGNITLLAHAFPGVKMIALLEAVGLGACRRTDFKITKTMLGKYQP